MPEKKQEPQFQPKDFRPPLNYTPTPERNLEGFPPEDRWLVMNSGD
jgi:hypothetical protein